MRWVVDFFKIYKLYPLPHPRFDVFGGTLALCPQAGIERLKMVNGCHQKIWITHLANDHHLVLQKEKDDAEVVYFFTSKVS